MSEVCFVFVMAWWAGLGVPKRAPQSYLYMFASSLEIVSEGTACSARELRLPSVRLALRAVGSALISAPTLWKVFHPASKAMVGTSDSRPWQGTPNTKRRLTMSNGFAEDACDATFDLSDLAGRDCNSRNIAKTMAFVEVIPPTADLVKLCGEVLRVYSTIVVEVVHWGRLR
jgi:hypothetical protein